VSNPEKNISNLTNKSVLSTITRLIRVQDYKRVQFEESQNLGCYNMESIPRKPMYLMPAMALIEEKIDKDASRDVIEFLVKQRAGSGATAPSYKLKVARFNEGTVEDWIRVRKAISELWRQNSISSAKDRVANVTAILRGESLTVFEAKIEELTNGEDEDGAVVDVPVDEAIVLSGLNAVAETVFPHRALETQKQWMRRGMKKPRELSFRKTASAVGRLNNCLSYFPGASEADKFNKTEVVELLEWSIPQNWKTKFDLDGYIPTHHSKERLVTECEAIERHEPKTSTKTTSTSSEKQSLHKKGRPVKHKSGEKTSASASKYYCTEHGTNPTHSTDSCYTIKNRTDRAGSSSGMTKKSFRKEINLLAQSRPKKKVLEMFASILKTEYQKNSNKKKSSKVKKSPKKKTVLLSESDESDEDESIGSINNMECDQSDAGQTSKKSRSPEIAEEAAYRKTITNLGMITGRK
jgi:hypothetical protein